VKHSTPTSPHSCKVEEAFDLPGLTPMAGLSLLIDFLRQRLGLRSTLETVNLRKAPWARYQLADELEVLLVGYLAGSERIGHMEELRHDPLVGRKLGLKRLPDPTTLYRTLDRFDSRPKVGELERVHRQLLRQLLPSDQAIVVDLDTTVQTVHGRQEGSSVGYNPRYPGRRSYQPLLAFEGSTGLLVHLQLRPGTTPSGEEQAAFWRRTRQQLPPGVRPRFVRADRGFGSEAFVSALEEDGVGYVVKIRLDARLEGCIRQGLVWKRLFSEDPAVEMEAASVAFRLRHDAPLRRVVLVRTRPLEEPAQRVLFEEDRWDYEAMVTNLPWDEEDVWRFYNRRCASENRVKELKGGMHARAISKARFWANAADLWLKAMAYNVLLAFQRLAPAAYQRFSLQRFRRALIRLPGRLVRHARRWRLRLPRGWPHERAWWHLRAQLHPT